MYFTGAMIAASTLGTLMPVYIPLICNGIKRPKVPAGTFLWLEMEQ